MGDSCADDFASSSSSSYYAHPCCLGAALVVTAVVSAAAGSFATAYLLRRRQDGRRDNNTSTNDIDGGGELDDTKRRSNVAYSSPHRDDGEGSLERDLRGSLPSSISRTALTSSTVSQPTTLTSSFFSSQGDVGGRSNDGDGGRGQPRLSQQDDDINSSSSSNNFNNNNGDDGDGNGNGRAATARGEFGPASLATPVGCRRDEVCSLEGVSWEILQRRLSQEEHYHRRLSGSDNTKNNNNNKRNGKAIATAREFRPASLTFPNKERRRPSSQQRISSLTEEGSALDDDAMSRLRGYSLKSHNSFVNINMGGDHNNDNNNNGNKDDDGNIAENSRLSSRDGNDRPFQHQQQRPPSQAIHDIDAGGGDNKDRRDGNERRPSQKSLNAITRGFQIGSGDGDNSHRPSRQRRRRRPSQVTEDVITRSQRLGTNIQDDGIRHDDDPPHQQRERRPSETALEIITSLLGDGWENDVDHNSDRRRDVTPDYAQQPRRRRLRDDEVDDGESHDLDEGNAYRRQHGRPSLSIDDVAKSRRRRSLLMTPSGDDFDDHRNHGNSKNRQFCDSYINMGDYYRNDINGNEDDERNVDSVADDDCPSKQLQQARPSLTTHEVITVDNVTDDNGCPSQKWQQGRLLLTTHSVVTGQDSTDRQYHKGNSNNNVDDDGDIAADRRLGSEENIASPSGHAVATRGDDDDGDGPSLQKFVRLSSSGGDGENSLCGQQKRPSQKALNVITRVTRLGGDGLGSVRNDANDNGGNNNKHQRRPSETTDELITRSLRRDGGNHLDRRPSETALDIIMSLLGDDWEDNGPVPDASWELQQPPRQQLGGGEDSDQPQRKQLGDGKEDIGNRRNACWPLQTEVTTRDLVPVGSISGDGSSDSVSQQRQRRLSLVKMLQGDDEENHLQYLDFPHSSQPQHQQQNQQKQQRQQQQQKQQRPTVHRSQSCLNVRFREEEAYISETERKFKGQESFFESVTSVSRDLLDSLALLRRTRVISALSNRLMAAADEIKCIEEVSRIMVLMFDVERVSYAMLTGSKHFLLKRVTAVRKKRGTVCDDEEEGGIDSSEHSQLWSVDLHCLDSDHKRPLAGTAAGACVAARREHYTPRTRDSLFETHKVFHRNGVNTVLVTPILVNGNKCAGCIMLARREEDGFSGAERMLIGEVGLLLGANIYAKRLLREAEEQRKRSREMLHSFIPPKVLEKIECYWDANSDEFKSRKSSTNSSLSVSSSSVGSDGSSGRTPSAQGQALDRTNSWYIAHSNWSDAENGDTKKDEGSREGVKEKIRLIKRMNRLDSIEDGNKVVIVSSTPGIHDFSPTSHALYAENVKNVCIVFTDIVGFSRMSMDIPPMNVMDMLQDLFNRFDELCDVHGVLKLETIGDAYICATNLMEEDDGDSVRDAAVRALAMAKDMIVEATNVRIPGGVARGNHPFETLQIRVGVHVGDLTCGVLGQRLPKFTTCGTAVNMAARMEQTSLPGQIRATKEFCDAVGDAETGWSEKETIPLKNMGAKETYLLDPMGGGTREGGE